MKKRGRSKDQALLRTAVNKKMQTFSHKRLMKDLEEIENEKIPTVGVTARPLEKDLFTWHANIRGPEKTLYEGGVFHLELVFPQSYPHHPPTISLFNTIPHPNVFGNYICLDMIQQNSRRYEGGGWSSAYSVQSILTQLQSFLFEQNLNQDKNQLELNVKKAVKEANGFNCRICNHGGKLSCWPAFSTKEAIDKEFMILDEENNIIKKELNCYHTKLPYTSNQLGLGLKISKIPRTGNIREAQTFFDYISIKAFLKESVNITSANQRMTHWIPVYFGKGDNLERFSHFLKKSMSMIMTNSTRNFKKEFVLQVMPKLIVTIIYHLMDEQKHASIRSIRLFIQIHSIFLFCLREFPQLVGQIEKNIKKFVDEENLRNKQNQPNLGCILAYLTAIDSIKFSDVAEAYFQEQLDRQVLWILKAIPELIDEIMLKDFDVNKIKIAFKSQITSFQMFCFYKLFICEVCEKRKSRKNLLDEYENNLCKLTNKEQEAFQQRIFYVQKNIKGFNEFFDFLGLKKRTDQELVTLLKSAISNSERKKYHGEFETIHELPDSAEQFKKILEKRPTYKKYFEVKTVEKKVEKKTQTSYEVKEKPSTDEDWKKMCVQRWAWIKEALAYDKTMTPNDISVKAVQFAEAGISKPDDRLVTMIEKKYKKEGIDYQEPKVDLPHTCWKQIFLRLDLEDFLQHIDMNPDFNEFYEKLEICKKSNLSTLLIPIIQINNLKSGFFYLTSLLGKLSTLKYLEFSGLPQMQNMINEKAAKAIKKGLTNFKEAGGQLDMLRYQNIQVNKDLSDYLFTYLSETQFLKSLEFKKTNMLIYGNSMKVLSNSLINIKNLEKLVFDYCNLNEEKCKILADSLMRTKKLRIFEIHDGNNLVNGLSSIIYNLAFSPNLLSLNISSTVSNISETVVSLYKLLRISASIEVISGSRIANLNPSLVKQFWISLGESKTLRVLDLSYSGDLTTKKTQIGNSIAFNAKKKGSLQYLNMTSSINGFNTIVQLYKGMCISEYDEERIYGDPNKASKMIASNYKPIYYNNLKAFEFKGCPNLSPNFNLSHFNKLLTKKDPQIVELLARSPNLQNVSFSQGYLNKNMAEILVLALDPRRAEFKSKIKVLDLSKNNLGKDGLKALTQILPHNNIIEVLDLSKNQMGVSGAHELAVSLKNNKSLKYLNVFNNKIGYDGAKAIAQNIVKNHPRLEFLQVGHNRIRDKGLKSIADCLIANKETKLKVLGLRFNFITNVGGTYLYNKLTGNKTNIEEIFMRNNLIDDMAINNLDMIKSHEKSNISIDLLQKIKFLDSDRSDRTIWIHPIENINLQNLIRFFEITYKCGIVLDARIRRAKKYPNKVANNTFGFIQFADSTSVTRALHLASRKVTLVDGVKFRIYKAGTGTFIYSRKTAKQKKLETAKKSLPPVPYDNMNPSDIRGFVNRARGRGGRGGRGRGAVRRR